MRKKRAAPVHFNIHGHRCHCPFGDPRKEKYKSKHEQEVWGSVHTAMWHEAAKYDWLMDRPDVKDDPHLQEVIHKLASMGGDPDAAQSRHDALLPWLLREYKKGRVHSPEIQGSPHYAPGSTGFRYTTPEGYNSVLTPDHLDQINDWMKYQKQKKEGVDIMKHEVGPAINQAAKNDLGGEVVHDFDDPAENEYPSGSGYKMVRLRNDRDMRREGERMNHCVGSNGMGYLEKNRDGEGAYYSLRDGENTPVATIEMEPNKGQYTMCPNCKKPTFGEIHHPLEGPMEDRCTNCNHLLQTMDPESRVWKPHEGVEWHDTKINYKKPTADHMKVSQMFGHSDAKVDDYHEDMANQWLSKHGHPYYYSDGDEDYEDEEPEFEPWWDSYYQVDGASDVEDWFNNHVHGDHYESAPDEYHRAMADAEEHGHEGPELELGDPDIHDIFQDSVPNSMSQVDPEMYKELFKSMHEHGHGDDFRQAAQNWLDEDYYPYMNPYGETNYVGNGPHEDLFAKNLNHHLEQFRHPNRGHEPDRRYYDHAHPQNELMEEYEMRNMGKPYNGPSEETIQDPQERMRLNLPGTQPQEDTSYTYPNPFMNPGQHPGQGNLFPHGFYTNNRGYRRQTDLPPELFPPEAEHSQANPQQGEMWTNRMDNTNSFINTQSPWLPGNVSDETKWNPQTNEYDFPQLPEGYVPTKDKPMVPWHAHVAGEWTDYGDEQAAGDNFGAPAAHGISHLNGRVMESNASHYPTYSTMDWRVPVAYHHPEDRLYVGQPAMEHGDMMQQWDKPSPWVGGMTEHPDYTPGFIDLGNKDRSHPGLQFFMNSHVPNEDQLHDWVEQRYGVRAPQDVTDLQDEDWVTSSEKTAMPWTQYGPRNEGLQEWAEWKTQPKTLWDEENYKYFKDKRPHHPPPPRPEPHPESEHLDMGDPDPLGHPEHEPFKPYWDHADGGGWRMSPPGQEPEPQPEPQKPVEPFSWIVDDTKKEPHPEPPKPDLDLDNMPNYERDNYDEEDWQKNPHPFKWRADKVPGKAFMDDNGQVHTWDERSGSRYWMHSDQAQLRGVNNDYDTHIYMEPGGYVDDRYRVGRDYPERAQEMYRQLQAGHPEVKVQWPGVADQAPAPEPEKPEYAQEENDDLWDM